MDITSCLGLDILGKCPSDNQLVYFSLGEAISALAITLIIPQFFKPIYTFRLRARRLDFKSIYFLVFLGTLLVTVASLIRSVKIFSSPIISYPYPWEILATICFIIAYSIIASVFLFSATTTIKQCKRFVLAAADLMAHGTEEDKIAFSKDLSKNIGNLISLSSLHGNIKGESAFYYFIHRYSIEQCSYARSFLRILSEPAFCSILISSCPWDTAHWLRGVANKKIYSAAANDLIRELGRQAIISPKSMMSREMGYKGFSAAPELTRILFRDEFICEKFQPAFGLEYGDFDDIDRSKIQRSQHAITCMFETMAENNSLLWSQEWHELTEYYRNLASAIRKKQRAKSGFLYEEYYLESGLVEQIEIVNLQLSKLETASFENFYVDPISKRNYDFLDCFAESVFEILCAVANDFEGGSDASWSLVLDVLGAVYPRYGNQPAGMNPLQQRLALKLISKVADNMRGYYPAITRVLILFCWENKDTLVSKSAWSLLLKSFRHNLRKFPQIENLLRKNYLPKSITYIDNVKSFTRTFEFGRIKKRTIKISSFPKSMAPFAVAEIGMTRDEWRASVDKTA